MKVALYKGKKRAFNRLVAWWTRSDYSHCEVLFEYDLKTNTYLCASSSYLDGGIRFKWINLDAPHWDIVEIKGDIEKVREWYKLRLGRPYDVKGIVGCVVRRLPASNDKWFCSSSIASALGYPEPWRVLPVDLKSIADFELTNVEYK